jgi:hypothetical protein
MRMVWRKWGLTFIAVTLFGDQSTVAYSTGPRAEDKLLTGPVVEALRLLGWSGDDVPRIELVATKPPDATATADAFVRFNENGSAMPIVYVRTDTTVYREAAEQDYQALVRLAGILAHERWHVRHGQDEIGAYTAQISIMEYLHANSMHLAQIRRALRHVQLQRRRIASAETSK